MLDFRGPDHSSSLPVTHPWGGRVVLLLDETGRRNKGNFSVFSPSHGRAKNPSQGRAQMVPVRSFQRWSVHSVLGSAAGSLAGHRYQPHYTFSLINCKGEFGLFYQVRTQVRKRGDIY